MPMFMLSMSGWNAAQLDPLGEEICQHLLRRMSQGICLSDSFSVEKGVKDRKSQQLSHTENTVVRH